MFVLKLPKLTIETQYPDDTALFVLGGRQPDAEWLKALDFQTCVWAVDRGADVCRAAQIVPERLIGDCDSADEETWSEFERSGVTRTDRYPADKDLTDFQLALGIFAKERKGGGIFLTGCFGGRFDHLWSSVISFAKPAEYRAVGLADEKEGMIFLSGISKAVLNFEEKPQAFSLLPLSRKCQGVCLHGTRWELNGAQLDYFEPYSISNRLDEDMCASVSLKNGLLAVYWNWKEEDK